MSRAVRQFPLEPSAEAAPPLLASPSDARELDGPARVPAAGCPVAPDLLARVAHEPPPWAHTPLLAWDEQRFERLKPFVRQKYWTDRGSLNVFRVIGTQHPAYQGLTWQTFLQQGVRMQHNLALYRQNPGYYTDTGPKRPAMYYLTLDGGLSYYVAEDGNHRTAIARFDCWYRQDLMLHGLTITDYRIDWLLVWRHAQLQAWLAADLRRRQTHRMEPVTTRVAREDGPGWMLETFHVRVRLWAGSTSRDIDADTPEDELAAWQRTARRWWGWGR